MEYHRLPKIAFNSSQGNLRLKIGWYKDTMAWLNRWGMDEHTALQDIKNLKNTISASKLKAILLDKKVLKDKTKLIYYKEVINPNLEDQKYLSTLISSKKKINIAKIRTNSHELHSEIRQ